MADDRRPIDKAIDAWHNIPTGVQLHEFLGMTREQYARFVEAGEIPAGSPYDVAPFCPTCGPNGCAGHTRRASAS